MKNLIVAFGVIALFALGSCGDDAVQPAVKNTVGQDTIKEVVTPKIKALNRVGLHFTFNDYGTNVAVDYPIDGSDQAAYWKPDTSSKGNYYMYRINRYPYTSDLSFTIDTISHCLNNIKLSCNWSPGGNDIRDISCQIEKLPYQVTDRYIIADFSGSPSALPVTTIKYLVTEINGSNKRGPTYGTTPYSSLNTNSNAKFFIWLNY